MSTFVKQLTRYQREKRRQRTACALVAIGFAGFGFCLGLAFSLAPARPAFRNGAVQLREQARSQVQLGNEGPNEGPNPTPVDVSVDTANFPVTLRTGGDTVVLQRSGAVEFRGGGWSSGEQKR